MSSSIISELSLQLSKKAYQVNLDKIDEGYLYCSTTCFADSVNKAKMELLKEVEDAVLNTGEVVTYLNIPVVRCPDLDRYIFEGKEYCIPSIKEIIEERNKCSELEKVLKDRDVTHCYITKHNSYYSPNMQGYTSYKVYAGVYTKEIAIDHAKGVKEVNIIPINNEEHNTLLLNHIENLKSRLIKTTTTSQNKIPFDKQINKIS